MSAASSPGTKNREVSYSVFKFKNSRLNKTHLKFQSVVLCGELGQENCSDNASLISPEIIETHRHTIS